MPTVEYKNPILFGQLVFEITSGAARIDLASVVVTLGRGSAFDNSLCKSGVRLAAALVDIAKPFEQRRGRYLGVTFDADIGSGEPAEGFRPNINLNDLLAVLNDLAESRRPLV